MNALWFGYTQQSHWQVYDSSHSRPFRESNYEPEIILSHRYKDTNPEGVYRFLKILNAGVVHQSNGQSNPRSRSWNRLYLQPGFETKMGDGTLIVLPKVWARIIQESNPAENDNPDITHYLGNGELEVRYQAVEKKWGVSALAKARSIQMDMTYLASNIIKRSDFSFHVQYFNGYGESLIDYNQSHSTLGIGVSFPY